MKRTKPNDVLTFETLIGWRAKEPFTEDEQDIAYKKLQLLVDDLEKGSADKKAQNLAAKLLRALVFRSKGRPKKLTTEVGAGLVFAVEWQYAVHEIAGVQNPLENALEDFREAEKAEGRSPTFETIKSYYNKGLRHMRDSDQRFAAEIDHQASKLVDAWGTKDEAVAAALRMRTPWGHGDDAVWRIVERRQYERGKRAEKK